MQNKSLNDFSSLGIVALIALAASLAHAQSRDPLIDPGRIIGGSTKQMRDVRPVRGFLPKPGLLRPGASGQAALVYINPTANFAAYSKVMLDPVAIWTTPDSALNRVPQNQRRAVANKFYSGLFNTVSKRCQMVRTPSPGTLRVRIALTDATTPNAAVNTVATFAPYVSTAYSVAAFAFNKGIGYFAGNASAEGYVTDGSKGTLLWEAVDKRGGTTALVANTLDNWRDVNNAIEAWSEKLASRLTELGACR
jgi:uncharacterized protein DUF3313